MKTEDILLELGKGSTRRPRVIDDKTFNENWDRIYGKKKRRINKMIKRNRHKISKISVKKKRNSRHVLNKASVIKTIRRKNRDMSKGMRATCYNSNYG